MSLIGKTLGKYKLIEFIGKGGMAYVYKAFDPDLARVVAVKVMHRYLCEDGSFVRRFGREAKDERSDIYSLGRNKRNKGHRLKAGHFVSLSFDTRGISGRNRTDS